MVNAPPDQVQEHALGAEAIAQLGRAPSTEGLQLLYDVVQALSGAHGLRQGLSSTLERVVRGDGWDLGIMWLNTPGGIKFQCAWHHPALDAANFLQVTQDPKLDLDACLAHQTQKRGALIFIEQIAPNAAWARNREAMVLGLTSGMGLPLRVGDNIYGVLELFSRSPRVCSAHALGLFQALSSDIGQFIEARHLEQQLYDNNAKLAEAHRIARMAYWELNLVNLQLHGNLDTAAVLGLTPESLPRDLHALYAIVPPEDQVHLQTMLAGAQRQEHPIVTVEHRVIAKDGRFKHLLVQALGRFDISGKPVRITGTIQDVTEQRQAAERARQSEQRWEIAFRNSPIPSLITSYDTGLCLDANDEMMRVMGLQLEQIVGRTTSELRLWPPNRCRNELIAQVHEHGRVRDFELHTEINGKESYLLINLEIIDFNGQRCLLGQWIDITCQKLLEESLRLTVAAVEHAGDALVLMDHRGNVMSVNPAFTQITGYTKEQASGQWFLGLIHKPSGRHDKAFFRNAVGTVETDGQWKGEAWAKRADGQIVPTVLTLSAIRDPHTQRVKHYVGVFSDISRQKEYEMQLQQMAWHDDLTGVANRSLLIERGNRALLQAERHDTILALVFVDLDRFKAINDTYGHVFGDELLKQVAERLCLCVRASDTVARIGGDEFVLLLPEVAEEEGGKTVLEKIRRAMLEPFIIGGQTVGIGASLGIAYYPQDGLDMPTLLQQADEGLYRMKKATRDDTASPV